MDPRTKRIMEDFTQEWEIYQVLSSELRLTTYMELDTTCNVEDLFNMVEIIEVKAELDEIDRIRREQQGG